MERNTYTTADHERAFDHWLGSGSLRDTAIACGIPPGTVAQWSTVEGWRQRRDDLAAEMESNNRQQSLTEFSQHRRHLLDTLADLADSADRDSVRLDAVKFGLSLLGVYPANLRGTHQTPHNRQHATTPTTPEQSPPQLTSDQADRLTRRFSIVPDDTTTATR